MLDYHNFVLKNYLKAEPVDFNKTMEETLALAERLGKTPITVKNAPGFVVNRILVPMINEAFFVLAEGLATPEDIDAGMKLGCNQPIGPLALADMIGLDVCLAVMNVYMAEFNDSKYRPAPLLKEMVAAGWLGRKTGRGFYRYGDGAPAPVPSAPKRATKSPGRWICSLRRWAIRTGSWM